VTITLPSPATVITIQPADFNVVDIMPDELGGTITAAPNKVINVDYPASASTASIMDGAAALDTLLQATTGPTMVFAYSEGASVATVWLIQHAATTKVSPKDVQFLLIGNPNRYTGLYPKVDPGTSELYWQPTPTDTQFTVTDVARKGDFFAHFANLNPLEYLSGFITHCNYTGVRLNAAANTESTSGTTTYVEVA
jgi:hypothetical protein